MPVVPCYISYDESVAEVDFPLYGAGSSAADGVGASYQGDTLISLTEKTSNDAMLTFFKQFAPTGSIPSDIEPDS